MDLETRLAAWRQYMQAAGIGPGPVRDELECHLRDSFEERVRAGTDPETAFAAAVVRLGRADEIRCECDAAFSAKGPLRCLFRSGVFPTNLNVCAWTALVLAPWLIIRGFARLPGGSISNLIPPILFLAGLAGFLGAGLWVGRKSPAAARLLALFWTVVLWYFLFGAVIFLLARLSPYLAGLISMGASFGFLLSCPAAAFVFFVWSSRLRTPPREIRI